MFTFLEYRGPFNFDYREEPITMPNGKPAKVITLFLSPADSNVGGVF